MSRYVKDVQLDQPIDTVSIIMEDFAYHNQFRRADWNGEMVHVARDRHGRDRYLKWSYVGGLFHVEAWLKGRFGGEMDLDGVGGGASREEYRKSMDELMRTLSQQGSGQIAAGHMGSDPIHHDAGHGDNHAAWSTDTNWQRESSAGQDSRQAEQRSAGAQRVKTWQTAPQSVGPQQEQPWQSPRRGGCNSSECVRSFMFAIFSIIFGLFMPIFGIVFAVVALREGSEVPKVKKMAIAGIVIAVLSMVGDIALFILSMGEVGFFNFI